MACEKHKLTTDSAVDELLYADGTHCLLLKEAFIEYIADNGHAVLASTSFAKLAESPSPMKEVMMVFAKLAENRERKHGD